MIFVFYALAAMLIFVSYRSLSGGFVYLRFFRNEIAKPKSAFEPFVTVIAPCRGVDEGMDKNLAALLDQDLPEYEVIFVVDDPADPAVAVIQRLLNRGDAETQRDLGTVDPETIPFPSSSPLFSASQRLSGERSVSTRLVVAPKANACSQKVANLREAVLHADRRSQGFAFVDSDTRPLKTWLRHLIAPLADDSVGAATGYRWFISEKPTFASELRSVWNASIASILGPDQTSNFCWGGSMAIRRDVFDRLDMREKWQGTLSDDLALTRAIKAADLPIVFVPQAINASVENCTFRELVEFTTRQIKITRVYAQPLWIISFIGSGLFGFVMLAAFLIVLISRSNAFAVWSSIATILIVSIFSAGKAWLRLQAVSLILTNYTAELGRQRWTQATLWLITPAIFFYNSMAALVSRRMIWRGIRYELKSPTETVIIGD